MANFPNHPPSQVGHVPLREMEFFLPSRQGFQELAREHATIITILLLWCVLRIVIVPPSEVKRFLSLVSMFRVQITPQGLEDLMSVKIHAVIRLYPLSTEVDGSPGPMRIVVVDRNKDDVFRKNINLLCPFR